MSLEVLPTRIAGAAENMAVDFLLLQRYPNADVARFRHYGWRAPAFSFGYSQKIAAVRAALPAGENPDLCRRPTGGGLVDHRDDWTYALVIPRGHALEDARATQSYREIHECLAAALQKQGIPAAIKNLAAASSSETPLRPGPQIIGQDDRAISEASATNVCFERAELFDVVHRDTNEKIAGAAQKRNKRGLLFQGSLWRPSLRGTVDEDQLLTDFTTELARVLGTSAIEVPWPEFNEDEVSGLTETYASPEWIGSR